jgi:YebC/PmpR family DNA-binding regulatory protein
MAPENWQGGSMSGHSKWSTIKNKKGALDAKRGQLFTRLTKEIVVAAKTGGGDPDMNPRLRLAIQQARSGNMPLDNIDRAIKRATGEGEGQANLEELVYEGFSPGGAAILVMTVTDNRNRASSEVRNAFDRNNGKMGQVGSVSYLFEQKGLITLEVTAQQLEEAELLAIENGAEDTTAEDSTLEIRTAPENFETLCLAFETAGLKALSSEITMIPTIQAVLDEKTAEQTLKLLDKLEDLDDVQKVITNADFPEAVLEKYGSAA